MSDNMPSHVDPEVVIYGLTTAVSSLKEKLEISSTENQVSLRQIEKATEANARLERQLAAKEKQLAAAIAAERQALQNVATTQQKVLYLESFMQELGLDVPALKRGELWSIVAAKLLKVVYDPTREPTGMTGEMRHVAQQIAIDRRPPQAA